MKTEILNDRNPEDIKRAAALLADGKLVAFPTETVYGLGANALDGEAVKRIFIAKGRPQDNPLIVHISNVDDAKKYAYTGKLFKKISEKFMPGPITVIMPKQKNIPDEVTAGLDSVGIRVPLSKTARKLIDCAGIPIAAPSANLSGKPSPTKATHVIDDLNGKVEAILCGDDCLVGVESTVVKITDENSIVICRPGGITYEMLKSICDNVTVDPAVLSKFDGKPVSPGMKYRHYAPNAEVNIIIGSENKIIEFLSDKLDFGIICYDEDKKLLTYKNSFSLGKHENSYEQAAKLFDLLRHFDCIKDVKKIYARIPEKQGVGLAVYNRLLKAAGFNVIDLGQNCF